MDCLLRLWKLGLLLLWLALPTSLQAQAYLGQTTKVVSLRTGPGTEHRILRSIPMGDNLFVSSKVMQNGFYAVVDITTNTEGYVEGASVRLVQPLQANHEGVFTPTGRTASHQCELEIYNRTEKTLTLKLDADTYTFQPHQRTKLTVAPRTYSYRASAAGVTPDFGTERLDAGTAYSWEFYIVTQYRRY